MPVVSCEQHGLERGGAQVQSVIGTASVAAHRQQRHLDAPIAEALQGDLAICLRNVTVKCATGHLSCEGPSCSLARRFVHGWANVTGKS
jgi:hypothetical protein